MKKLMELITADDNTTLEPVYAWAAPIIVVGIGLEIYSVIYGKTFSLQDYGLGVAAILAAVGVPSIFNKQQKESKNDDNA